MCSVRAYRRPLLRLTFGVLYIDGLIVRTTWRHLWHNCLRSILLVYNLSQVHRILWLLGVVVSWCLLNGCMVSCACHILEVLRKSFRLLSVLSRDPQLLRVVVLR